MSRNVLALLMPVLRFSAGRDAYVLRVVGSRVGPVLRVDRRSRREDSAFRGLDRRGARLA